MSAPRFVDCKCGHGRALHPKRTEEACTVCDCEEYLPVTVDRMRPGINLPSARADQQPTTTIEELLTEAKQSGSKRLVSLAEKIGSLLVDLRQRVKDDEANAALRREAVALEDRLRAIRAQMRGEATTKPRTGPARGEYRCDHCDHVSPTSQGRSAHARFNHQEVAS